VDRLAISNLGFRRSTRVPATASAQPRDRCGVSAKVRLLNQSAATHSERPGLFFMPPFPTFETTSSNRLIGGNDCHSRFARAVMPGAYPFGEGRPFGERRDAPRLGFGWQAWWEKVSTSLVMGTSKERRRHLSWPEALKREIVAATVTPDQPSETAPAGTNERIEIELACGDRVRLGDGVKAAAGAGRPGRR
jgi:hypothetical protein